MSTTVAQCLWLLAGALIFGLSLFPAHAQSVDQTSPPNLRIETGMHTAQIASIATDAGNHYLVTGSDDKTVRVWDTRSAHLLQTLRPPLGQGSEGKIHTAGKYQQASS